MCQVIDLLTVKPHEFIQYGLGCLEKFASLGDTCAKETRERLRIVVRAEWTYIQWYDIVILDDFDIKLIERLRVVMEPLDGSLGA